MIKILIVDDHPAVGEGTRTIVEQEEDMQAYIVTDADHVMELIKENQYDIYLVDLSMPQIDGLELTKMILQVHPDACILIYTGFDIVPHYNLLIGAGASGFISKTSSPDQLITAIRCACREEAVIPIQLLKQLKRVIEVQSTNDGIQKLKTVTLTDIEQQILVGVSKGLTNTQIAKQLHVGQRTVEYHLTKVFSKFDVGSRTEAVTKAIEFGLLTKQYQLEQLF